MNLLGVTEIQTDFYRVNDVGHVSGIVLAKRPTQFSVLSVHRSLRHGPFTTGDVALLDHIAPHLVRAWDITGTLRRTVADARALVGALDTLRAAVFLVDAEGFVRRLSPEAEQLACRGDCLRIRNNRLEAVHPADDAALRKLLAGSMLVPALGPPDPAMLAPENSAGIRALALKVASNSGHSKASSAAA